MVAPGSECRQCAGCVTVIGNLERALRNSAMSLGWRHPNSLTRSRMLEGSLRCFTLGLLGFAPLGIAAVAWVVLAFFEAATLPTLGVVAGIALLGIPLAVLALLEFRGVVLHKRIEWNPARRYLVGGALLGGIGLIILLLFLVGLMLALPGLLVE